MWVNIISSSKIDKWLQKLNGHREMYLSNKDDTTAALFCTCEKGFAIFENWNSINPYYVLHFFMKEEENAAYKYWGKILDKFYD